MIDLDGMISIPYLKKTTFTGSEKEMNFMIRKEAGENGDVLQAAAWPGPYIFSVTEDEKNPNPFKNYKYIYCAYQKVTKENVQMFIEKEGE